MNADKHDNMLRIKKMSLAEWEDGISIPEAYRWWHDLCFLIQRTHYEIDKADVTLGDGDLRERAEWLRVRCQEAEDELATIKAAAACGGGEG